MTVTQPALTVPPQPNAAAALDNNAAATARSPVRCTNWRPMGVRIRPAMISELVMTPTPTALVRSAEASFRRPWKAFAAASQTITETVNMPAIQPAACNLLRITFSAYPSEALILTLPAMAENHLASCFQRPTRLSSQTVLLGKTETN